MMNENVMDVSLVQYDVFNALRDKDNELTMMRSQVMKLKKREKVLVRYVRDERIRVKMLKEELELLKKETLELSDENIIEEVEIMINLETNLEEIENANDFEKRDNNENTHEENLEKTLAFVKSEPSYIKAGSSSRKDKTVVENMIKIEIETVDESKSKREFNISPHNESNLTFESDEDNLAKEILDELFEHEHEGEKKRLLNSINRDEGSEFEEVVEENIKTSTTISRKREFVQNTIPDHNESLITTPSKKMKPRNSKTEGSKRKKGCDLCPGCLTPDCSLCKYCLDKPKFGGENRLRRRCVERRCETFLG